MSEETQALTITNQITTTDFFGSLNLMVKEGPQLSDAAKSLFAVAHYAKLGQETILGTLITARRIGMDPMYALNGGIYSIKGKYGISAEGMNSLVRAKGHSIVIDPTSNSERSVLIGKRADNGDSCTCTYTLQDAQRAGLVVGGGTWEKHPGSMCFARAVSNLCRRLFPDVIAGLYVEDEINEIAKGSDKTPKLENAVIDIDPKKMSPLQVAEIEGLFAQVPEMQEKVLSTYGAIRAANIPADHYVFVTNWLNNLILRKNSSIQKAEEDIQRKAEEFQAAQDGE